MTTPEPHASENIDADELQKFSELAPRWWDPQGEFKPLHQLNPTRLDFINKRTPLKGLRVLDVGCGGGILSESMAAVGATVTAIDMSDAALNVARLHAQTNGLDIDYRKISAEALAAQQPRNWDIVTCLEMLEHVPAPSSVVAACAELVKPDGAVYFSTLNRHPKSFLLGIVVAEYVLNLLPKGTHRYDKFIRPSELYAWCEAADLNMREITGLHYNPLLESCTLSTDVSVNYLTYCRHNPVAATDKPHSVA